MWILHVRCQLASPSFMMYHWSISFVLLCFHVTEGPTFMLLVYLLSGSRWDTSHREPEKSAFEGCFV